MLNSGRRWTHPWSHCHHAWLHEGRLELNAETVRHLETCLGCRACETACPSGVHYGELIEGVRPYIEQKYRRPILERFKRKAINALFPILLVLDSSRSSQNRCGIGIGKTRSFASLPQQLRYWLVCSQNLAVSPL